VEKTFRRQAALSDPDVVVGIRSFAPQEMSSYWHRRLSGPLVIDEGIGPKVSPADTCDDEW
jgi:hypothetical protein